MFTLVEWLDCYVIYKNVFGIRFTKRKAPYIVVIVLACVLQGVALCFLDDIWREFNSVIIGLIAAFALTEGNRGKATALYPVVVVMYCLVNILSSYGLAAILGMSQETLADSLPLTIVAECASIILFSVYGLVIRKRLSQEFSFSWPYACILLLGSICCLFFIGFAQGVWNSDEFIFTIKEEVWIVSIILILVFMVLIVWQHNVKTKALKVELENEKYRLYLQGQQEHIQLLLEDDERRRRLKHDLRAHMLALNTYAQKGELENVQEYLQKMEESFCVEQAKRYTGILGVDAIINDMHKKAIEESVSWSFEGTLKNTTEIVVFDWCVLFSNLLTNALEATRECNVEKRIEVKISNIQEKVVLIVRNTCNENVLGTERPQTIKQDKINHGLGLKNVEEIIKKRDGTINYNAVNGWFEITVIL